MNHKRVSAEEAYGLMEREGYLYIDVRTPEEFVSGHPKGAYNIPVALRDPATSRMLPNEDFVSTMELHFPKESKLVLGCRCGPRSARAASLLKMAGYTEFVDNAPGWIGGRDGSPGWGAGSLPKGRGLPEGRSHGQIKV